MVIDDWFLCFGCSLFLGDKIGFFHEYGLLFLVTAIYLGDLKILDENFGSKFF